ncbi:GTPase domain-containing protein [Corynebacterium parakroppenstedtii]|uniref:GTPase domain-containing protein n=1 Tax=Corynebacterium parakroppenstedtii TaxID=2828363 RepID=UPI0030EF5AE7
MTLLVAGPPGVGKSTLVNSLIWAETRSTAPDSLASTSLIGGTTEATFYRAGSAQGLGLIDTPGSFIYLSEDERKNLLYGLPTPDALIYVTTNDIGDDDLDALDALGFNPAATVVTTNRSDEFDGGYASPEDAIAVANTKANDIRSQSAQCEVSQVLFRLSRWENLEYAKKI